MDSAAKGPEEDKTEAESLEGDDAVVEQKGDADTGNVAKEGDAGAKKAEAPKAKGIVGKLQRINIYLLLFIFVVVVAFVIIAVGYLYNKKSAEKTNTVKTQSLSQETLDSLANSDVTVGDSKQVLNVQSSAVFAGKVLVRDSMEIAQGLKVGGSLSLNGIKVTGSSNFDDVSISQNLAVTGNGSFQGQLLVQKSLSVSGGANITGNLSAGQITTSALQMSGNLTLTKHLVSGGSNPGRSNGSALGSGGTSSVSGSDIAGSITINTGSGTSAGCFITVNFATRYGDTPHIVITPVGSAAADLNYYINRSATNFSVCSTNAAPSGQTFGFDYVIFG